MSEQNKLAELEAAAKDDFAAWKLRDILWMLRQLRACEDEITQACAVACDLCRKEHHVRRTFYDGWLHGAEHCFASPIRERRYQRQAKSAVTASGEVREGEKAKHVDQGVENASDVANAHGGGI